MRPPPPRATPPTIWIFLAVSCLFFGTVVGYVIGTSTGGGRQAGTPAPGTSQAPPATGPGVGFVDERQVQAYRDILARDPQNLQAATTLANMLYDAGRYAEAVPLYRQALSLAPANINISTDLGTSLWYTGQPDQALAQFEKSLAIDPSHAQTLFNQGIVLLEGKRDAKAAVASWEKLLATNPAYGDRERVQQLIAQARSRF